uniref:Phosphatidylinositol N-acetylglucosaminyltransferase subunit C n=1 Tax=Parasteatoda tepidariorum TaxID=114398 RepID=A0A2L2YJU6_PARTP
MPEKWEKVLYKKQKYPDNYVDASFLSDLRKNVNLYRYSWWEAFIKVCLVTHEICCTVFFVIIFIFMEENNLSVIRILGLLAILAFSCFLIIQITSAYQWTMKKSYFYEYFKSAVIFFIFGYMFSPVLKTLTQTISTDTIYAMVVLMMIVHLLFQDYGTDAAIVSGT